MKIKKLEIKGFKSFPDQTVLEFKPGITCVVGPNGCGKSNIFEAIRWVMGEQRIRALRGKKMEDVIFSGSDTRKPVGMAEVRLVLSNTDGMFPASMADYDEIMITRRLFRDGESQYEINSIPCRLSDVTDFFLDTGVGRNSYAIIEQGRVDMVVNSKPEDRRVLIEEAAGINRYKARREAAIKRLERTRQNLLRISDVIDEVKRQNASLKRQAQKAERYRRLSDRLKELDLAVHAHRCARLQEQYGNFKRDLEAKRVLLSEKETRMASAQAELEKERLDALQMEKALKELLEARHRIDLELSSVRGHIERDSASIAQLADFRARFGSEKESLEEKRVQALGLHEKVKEEKLSVDAEIDSTARDLEKVSEAVQAIEAVLAQQRELVDRLKDDIFRTLQETAQVRNRREGLKRRRTEILAQIEKITGESRDVGVSLEGDQSRRAQLATEVDESIRVRNEEIESKEGLLQKRLDVQQKAASLKERLAQYENQLAATTARCESLEEMEKSYSSYGEGVRFLMQNQEFRYNGSLVGPLAEMIEVPPELEKALTAALGERLGHLVVSSPRKGVEAATRLQEAEAGRSTFIPVSPRSETPPSSSGVPLGLTSLKDMVHFREGFEDLGNFLLGRCFVVDDIRKAVEIWESNGIDVDLVTPKGEVLNRYGEITGGSQEKVRDEIFRKKREISELRTQSASLESERLSVKRDLDDCEATAEKVSGEISRKESSINALTIREAGLRKDRELLDAQMEKSRRRLEVLLLETESLKKELEALTTEIQDAEEKIGGLETRLGETENERADASGKVEEFSALGRQNSAKVAETRVRLAQLQERGVSLDKDYRSSREASEQLDKQLSSLLEEMNKNTQEEKRLTTEIENARSRESELMKEHQAQAEKINALQADAAAVEARVKALEEEANVVEKEARELTDIVHSVDMETLRVAQTLEALVEKILERYHVDPRSLAPPETLPDESEIGEIKEKLDSMGEVNLAAIVESRHTEERLTFLMEQQADLNKAVDSLYATIDKINKTTRERFRDAFDKINEKFQEIFPSLFRGGEARLELTDEEDLLETGVEILARPPGKRVRNMDLLSGGEKALTAVGLIFSIFLTKPSPFCLLDEVDAPLDDSNIFRFNQMLSQLSEQTQFLVVTHNKRSMETSDTLYGVTMEEPGSSTVVSVEFIH